MAITITTDITIVATTAAFGEEELSAEVLICVVSQSGFSLTRTKEECIIEIPVT